MSVWLKANQSVCTHEMSLVCLVTEEDSIETIFVVIISSLLPCQGRSKRRERIITVFAVFCLVFTVSRHVRSSQKEHVNNHKVVTELVGFIDRADLVVIKIPREWVLLEIFNNVNDE